MVQERKGRLRGQEVVGMARERVKAQMRRIVQALAKMPFPHPQGSPARRQAFRDDWAQDS